MYIKIISLKENVTWLSDVFNKQIFFKQSNSNDLSKDGD